MPTRGTILLKKKSIKNEKLYGRPSQSSQITPGSLQQSLSLTPPPHYPHKHLLYHSLHTALPSLPSPPSPMLTPNHQLHLYNHLPQHAYDNTRKSAQTTFSTTRTTIFFFYLGFLSQPFTNHRAAGEGGGHFFSSFTTTFTRFAGALTFAG